MRKTLITTLVLGACVGTQAFAATAVQLDKEGVITFALTRYAEYSLNNSTVFTNFTPAPLVYKTAKYKLTTANVLQAISQVLYGRPNVFSSRAQLVFGKGADGRDFRKEAKPADGIILATLNHNDELSGFFGTGTNFDYLVHGNVQLDNGRNHHLNILNGTAPTGLSDPWGQIWAKDYDSKNVLILCINVTYFFDLQVQECYDCFYLNSFITDTTFKLGTKAGAPCCSPSYTASGSGTDKYYLTWVFDNTQNNPHLKWLSYTNDDNENYDWFVDLDPLLFPAYYFDLNKKGYPWTGGNYHDYVGGGGLVEADDGIHPDGLKPGEQNYHSWDLYTLRFTLDGILTYKWNLKMINATDPGPDFFGSASMDASGYGYAQKVCSLIDGTVTIVERLIPDCACCEIDSTHPLYGALDGWYYLWSIGNVNYGHYHAYNDNIFYHLTFNDDYEDFEQWVEDMWSPVGIIGP